MPTTQEVGRRLKELRSELGMTLKDVATLSGMSPTHISEIERGKTSPTVGALRRIAAALKKDTAYFVEEAPLPRVSVVKKEDRESVLMPGDGDEFLVAKRLTTGIPAGRISVVLVDDTEGKTITGEPHEGEEAIVVLSGQMKASVGGTEYTLGAGDCLHYAARLPHSAGPVGTGKTKALWVKVMPGVVRW
jgi:transcriptional regulator with XRE-family HTH domain